MEKNNVEFSPVMRSKPNSRGHCQYSVNAIVHLDEHGKDRETKKHFYLRLILMMKDRMHTDKMVFVSWHKEFEASYGMSHDDPLWLRQRLSADVITKEAWFEPDPKMLRILGVSQWAKPEG